MPGNSVRTAGEWKRKFPVLLPALLMAIFAAEFSLMLFFHFIGEPSPLVNALIDSTLLIVFVSPFLYLYAKNQLRRGNEMAALLEGAKAVLKYREFPESARSIFDQCKRVTGATAGYVALLKADGTENEVLFLDAGGRSCSVDPSLPMPIRGLRAIPYHEGRAVYDNKFSSSPYWSLMPMGHVALDNVLFVPLKVEGKTLGLLGLANKPGGFTDEDVRTGEMFGEMAAIALVNSHTIDKLTDSESRFRSVAESSNEALVTINMMGNIVFWNRRAEGLFGQSAEKMLGRPLSAIIPARHLNGHQAGLSRNYMSGSLKNGGKMMEVEGVRADGSEFPLELSIYPWQTKEGRFYTGAMRDISERKNAEEALRRSHEELETRVKERTAELARINEELSSEVVERRKVENERARLITAISQSAEMVVIAREDGIIQYVNPSYERFTGFTADEAVNHLSILPEKMPSLAGRDAIWRTISSGQGWQGNVYKWKKDGTMYEEHAAYSPVFDETGKIINYVAIMRDMTSEGMLHKARDYFTTVTSHELRTPITKLQLVRTLLRDYGASAGPENLLPVITVLDEAYGALNRILIATTLFLELNRPESEKKMAAEFLHLDLLLCVQNARLFLERGKKGVRFSVDVDRLPKDAEVLGDHEMIINAIDNVLANAIKFTPLGKEIALSAWVEDRTAIIEVRDEGVGIPKEQLALVFEPYFSPENIMQHPTAIFSYAGGSIGLGLSITRMIMEHHKGSLILESAGKDKGTKVRLVFPILERKSSDMSGGLKKVAGF